MFCATSSILYKMLLADAAAEVHKESTLRMEMALAMRRFTIEEVRPLLQSVGRGDEAAAVPAHAAIREMELLDEKHPEFRYREVALHPLNPANLAQGWQVALIQAFQADPSHGEQEQVTDVGSASGPILRVARAVRPTSDCMTCHAASTRLPGSLAQRFGPPNKVPWQVGQVEAAQIVSVPMGDRIAQARRAWFWYVGATLAVFGTVFGVLNRLLSRMVVAPMERGTQHWRAMAKRDALTGARNRHGFEAQGADQLARCRADGLALSLVSMDIDHFKRINDQWGHGAGDVVLKQFVQCVLATIKRQDDLFRIGGEEFVLLLPDTTLEGAMAVAWRLQEVVRSHSFPEVGNVTASFGVACAVGGEGLDALLKRADRALYAAKAAGRDRIEWSA